MLGWALALISCGAPDWFEAPPPVHGTDCASWAPAAPASRRVEVAVALGRGVSAKKAAWHTRWASHVWAQWGVTMHVAGPQRTVSADPIFAGTSSGSVHEVVAPLAGRLSGPRADVRLVVVPSLAEPGSPAARWFDPLVGFTVVPAVARGGDPVAAALRAVGVNETTVPTVFLSLDALDALPEERARFGLAHELGHALGLEHVPESGNLMGPGFPRCLPTLTGAQRAVVGG